MKESVVIGCDFNDKYTQISYFFLDAHGPETLKVSRHDERYNIPTCLCKKRGVNRWFFGKEALDHEEDGILMGDLVTLARTKTTIPVEDKEVSVEELLALFLKKTFTMVSTVFENRKIKSIIITTEKIDPQLVNVLKRAIDSLNMTVKKIFFQSYEESFYYYIMNQPKELWNHQVGMFDFCGNVLKSYRLEMNHKTNPIITIVHKQTHENITRPEVFATEEEKAAYYLDLDEKFLKVAQDFLEGHIVSSVLLIGSSFDEEWYKQTLRFLCKNRRIFSGNNLYSKGACFAAKERVMKESFSKEYVFLSDDKLKVNVGMTVLRDGGEIYLPLLNAGSSWFEVDTGYEFFMEKADKFNLIISPIMAGGEVKTEQLELTGFEDRPPRTVRLDMHISSENINELTVSVSDVGFGDFYPPSSQRWEKSITI